MRVSPLVLWAAVVTLVGCGGVSPLVLQGDKAHTQGDEARACGGSHTGQAQCDVLIESDGARSTYSGWDAKDLEAAYNLPIAKGKGQSVYIVDAYDNPDVAGDFAAYRKGMGLPAGTLYKYNQDGQMSNYPQNSPGWGVEIDLDVEMASASCPKCKIDLVEANSNAWSDIEAAEAEAVKLGGTIVSNSYDGSGANESYYDTKGVTYLASSGDGGLGLYDPATFQAVIAVGGTFLNSAKGKRGYSETVWPDSGGGCSATDEAKPPWQKDPDCKYRTGNDVSAVAVNVAEYDTDSEGGWITVDGTSISSPLVAGMVALAGNSTRQDGGEMLWTLTKAEQRKYLYRVNEGSDGGSCHDYLCECGTKQFGRFCGPAGWGTPHGVGAL
ncbi:MAG: S8 family serine peptidase [Candidatus Cybelea sp.]